VIEPVSRLRFEREPVCCTLETYNLTIAHAVDVFSTYPGIHAIYQYGGISTPGISDLDLLLVFADDAPTADGEWSRPFDASELYVFMHGPAVVTQSLFARGAYLASLHGLRLLWGEAAAPEALDGPAREFADWMLAAEHLTRLLVSTARQIAMRVVLQRPALCELHSIAYDLQCLGDEQSAWHARLITPLRTLRSGWFDLPPETRQAHLYDLLLLAREAELDLLGRIGAWALRLTGAPPVGDLAGPGRWPGVRLAPGDPPDTYFVLPAALHWMLALPDLRVRKAALRFGALEIALPPALLALLRGASADLPEPYAAAARSRAALGRANARFLARLGGGFGSVHVPPFVPL
jgi:hypothetical protein